MGIGGRVPQEVSRVLALKRGAGSSKFINRGGSVDGGFQIFRTDGHLQMKSMSALKSRRGRSSLDFVRFSSLHYQRIWSRPIALPPVRPDYPSMSWRRLTYHLRVDLHDALKALAISDTLPGEPATIHVASKVTSCDCENGIVYTESGEEFRGDLVIGADGV